MRPPPRPRIDPEDLVLYGLLVVIGLIPVAITVLERWAFGFDATLGLIMVVTGIIGLAIHVARAHVGSRSR
jgi:hypothetical protein